MNALLSALAVGSFLAAGSAHAETAFIRQYNATPRGDVDISPMLGTYALIGLQYGAKGAYRVVPKGFISALNDSVSVDLGLFQGSWLALEETYATASMRWDFHVSRRWTVFGAPGLYARKTTVKAWDDEITTTTSSSIAFQAGGFLHFTDALAMRLEWDTGDAALRVGGTLKM